MASPNFRYKGPNACQLSIQRKVEKPSPIVYLIQVLPMEVTVRSTRWAYQNSLTPSEYIQAMLMELEDLDKVRLAAFDHMVVQKQRVAKAYDKRVRRKSFSEGDLVWQTVLPLGTKTPKYGKWSPTWEGPYQIGQVFRGNVYLLMDLDGKVHTLSMVSF
ncbi:uncharacterized protein LOC131327683 [Rhododendron vialii]|uniref:uncharacterized protein LOC131327683 n=1 Tax=Rhododendron vialii TaxID=182163 RepID=UPI00265F0DC3|nr:uncharacterized protein LOC131327683 [Rhododendron vialii]